MEDWRLKGHPARWAALGLFALQRSLLRLSDTIKSFYAVLLNGRKGGAALHDQGRFDALLPEIQNDFDVSYMSRMAVGLGWTNFSAAQKEARYRRLRSLHHCDLRRQFRPLFRGAVRGDRTAKRSIWDYR